MDDPVSDRAPGAFRENEGAIAPSVLRGWRAGPALVALLALLAAQASCGGGGGGSSGIASASSGGGTGGGGAAPPATAAEAWRRLLVDIAPLSSADKEARIARFVDTCAASEEGFPLRDGTRAIFVYRGPLAPPVAVAGTFNGWSTTASPLAPVLGTSWLAAEVDLGTRARHEYKFVSQGRTWSADPLNRKFAYGYFNSVANLAGSGASHLEKIPNVHATRLQNDRDILVYLPAGYLDAPAERYPVLYMQDGQNVFDPAAPYGGWQVERTADRLIAQGAIRKLIVVALSNTLRRSYEYTHTEDCIAPGTLEGGGAADYADFVVNEVKPLIDRRYRTLAGRSDTAILGSSFGGLISLWIGLEYPQVFRNAGGMSTTANWGRFCEQNPRIAEVATQKGKLDLLVYIDSGGGLGPSGIDADSYGANVELRHTLEGLGYSSGTDLLYVWAPGALHNEAAWRDRVENPLRFWFHP